MQRWLEDFEMKHIDFMRSIKSFHTMHLTWETLANRAKEPGKVAFARRQSKLYLRLHEDARKRFGEVAETRFRCLSEDNLVEVLKEFRHAELGWFEEATRNQHNIVSPPPEIRSIKLC